MAKEHQSGFTLIELSIVLAIIGIIVGGVMAGQYLIRQSQLQSITTSLTKYRAAYYQFKSQYNGMPGDILDATDYWNTDPNGCPTNSVYTPRKETCNGDGDNNISYINETIRAWQQLADAGLVEGTFSGVTGPAGTRDTVGGQNVPLGKIPNTSYNIYSWGPYSGDSDTAYYNIAQSVFVSFGLDTSTAWSYHSILTAREQYNLDLKMDDGKPSTGSMLSFKSIYNSGCTTSDISGSAAYQLSTSGPACTVLYIIDH